MEKSLMNCKKIELILNLNIKKSLLTTFKTIQAFNDSKRITGLNFEEFSEKSNSKMISALNFNINSEKSDNRESSQKFENQVLGKSEKSKLIHNFFNKIQNNENSSLDLSESLSINSE